MIGQRTRKWIDNFAFQEVERQVFQILPVIRHLRWIPEHLMAFIDPKDGAVRMHISKAVGNVSDNILIVDDAVDTLRPCKPTSGRYKRPDYPHVGIRKCIEMRARPGVGETPARQGLPQDYAR